MIAVSDKEDIKNYSLAERQAWFVYEGARVAAIAANDPNIPDRWEDREEQFRKQMTELIALQCGPLRSSSPEEMHGSWMGAYRVMGWVYGPVYDRANKIHPDLVPYNQLGQLERDKDAVFVALCEIARQWVYDGLEYHGPTLLGHLYTDGLTEDCVRVQTCHRCACRMNTPEAAEPCKG